MSLKQRSDKLLDERVANIKKAGGLCGACSFHVTPIGTPYIKWLLSCEQTQDEFHIYNNKVEYWYLDHGGGITRCLEPNLAQLVKDVVMRKFISDVGETKKDLSFHTNQQHRGKHHVCDLQ